MCCYSKCLQFEESCSFTVVEIDQCAYLTMMSLQYCHLSQKKTGEGAVKETKLETEF